MIQCCNHAVIQQTNFVKRCYFHIVFNQYHFYTKGGFALEEISWFSNAEYLDITASANTPFMLIILKVKASKDST